MQDGPITASASASDQSADDVQAQLARDAANIAAQLSGGSADTVPDLTQGETPLTQRIGDAIDGTLSDLKGAEQAATAQLNWWIIAGIVILVLVLFIKLV